MTGAEAILHDLIDMALAEDLAGVASLAVVEGQHFDLPLAPCEWRLRVPLPDGDAIVFRARPSRSRSPSRLSRPPVLHVSRGVPPRSLPAHELLTVLAELLPDPARWPALPVVLADLVLAPGRVEAAARAAAQCLATIAVRPHSMLGWERLAALRDRPFHPTARVRSGWTEAEHDRYGPEAAPLLSLDWVAVRRDCTRAGARGPGPGDEAVGVLSSVEAVVLSEAMAEAGLDGGDYLPLPVHPWQRANVLPQRFAAELADGLCTPLSRSVGSFVPTASVRTLAPPDREGVHLKLPLGVSSLGALRLLPARYLYNGGQGQRLLTAVAARDPLLGARLRLCDERSWWVFHRDGLPEDVAGQLGCLVRHYPPDLVDDPQCTLVPLAALGVTTPDGAAPGLTHLGSVLRLGVTDVLTVVARALTEVALSCFAAGAMPELHGQNVVLAVRGTGVAFLVLRDHDTVRIHRPWLGQAGVDEPDYVVRPGTPNTLVNETPEALLSWFQTLGLQVALAAAVEAEATASGHDEDEGWEAVVAGVREALGALDLPADAARIARYQLLGSPRWPAKRVLTPLLEQTGQPSASMPSARGEAANPLLGGDRPMVGKGVATR